MTDIATLISRIDQEIATDVKRQKAAWDETVRATGERERRLSATKRWPSTSSTC